jgi:beta-mannosidase
VGVDEQAVQWIGESDWLYTCRFTPPADFAAQPQIDLCFDGLDTFATVWLNGTQILRSDNMFEPQRVAVHELLQPGQTNELRILFESALRLGHEIESQYGKLACWNGDASRLYVRKAQYHYGWDWGPVLMTSGPWRPVRLEAYSARIVDLHTPTEVSSDLHSAQVSVAIKLEGATIGNLVAHVVLQDPAGAVVAEVKLPVSASEVTHTFNVAAPRLWWPRGYGEQQLYRVNVSLLSDGRELDRREQRIGLRRLRLVQQPLQDEEGTSFFFEINNLPIFCGGANWIPADSFLSRITPERYRDWLHLVAEGNMLMLRVWGGGIYEEDIFYDLCDELGLLVWQDFMFACGLYPAHESFIVSVRREAEANVRRLRHHPSIALWCGNNEDYLLASSLRAYHPEETENLAKSAMPARAIYEKLLPGICAQMDPARPYWPGSPYKGSNANDLRQGDQHIWDIWHGAMEPYQNYDRFPGRFVSEFGMQSFPDLALIENFTASEERYAQSQVLDWHNKGDGGPRRIAAYIIDNFRVPDDFASYIYVSQLMQAEALASGVRVWRRRWAGPGREYSAGALIWQINDCWPVTSWAMVDYSLRPKPAYYVVRRELASLALGFKAQDSKQAAFWVSNGQPQTVTAELELRTWTLSGKLQHEEKRAITLEANRTTELGNVTRPSTSEPTIIAARLLRGETVLTRGTLWPEPFKYLKMPDPQITLERLDGQTLRVQAKHPAKGVWFSANSQARWSDNMLDLFPDDPQIVHVSGLGKGEIRVRYYGDM